jgi:hypothetical protein
MIQANIDKIKKELTEPIFNHINTLNKEQLIKQREQLEIDMKLIETDIYFKGNKNDLYRVRNIELSYLNYLLN